MSTTSNTQKRRKLDLSEELDASLTLDSNHASSTTKTVKGDETSHSLADVPEIQPASSADERCQSHPQNSHSHVVEGKASMHTTVEDYRSDSDDRADELIEDEQDHGSEEEYYDDFHSDEEDREDEDEDAHDYEVEEHDCIIPGELKKVFKIRIAVSREEPSLQHLLEGIPPQDWLENFHARCTLDGNVIGYAFGRYVTRGGGMARAFRQNLEAVSRDMSDISLQLFDKYGYLKSKLKNHVVQKGTGVWGEELDHGSLFVIELTEISDRKWRRKGLGTVMVKLMIEKAERKAQPEPMSPETAQFREIMYPGEDLGKYEKFHSIVVPGCLRSDVEEEQQGKSQREQRMISHRAIDSAVSFYRSLGFRRIGTSDCLGLSTDPTHKSYTVAVADDIDPPLHSAEDDLPEENDDSVSGRDRGERKKLKMLQRLKEALPLHHVATTLPDADCLDFLKSFTDHAYTIWHKVDRLGNTLIHISACKLKPQTLKWLMDNFDAGDSLSSTRNLEGHTPFESLQAQVETQRTEEKYGLARVRDISDRFVGFAPEVVQCLALLAYPDIQKISTLQCQRLKFGCNCGECLEGFISPRMKLALLFEAETSADALELEIEDAELWHMMNDYMLVHVEPGLRQNMKTNKSYRKGFANIFALVAACLNSNIVPRQDNILESYSDGPSEWPPYTRSYLNRAGSLESKIQPVLRIIFEHACDQDEKSGDGEFHATMGKEVEKLKPCRNDHEYGFVSSACGLMERNFY